MAVASFGPQLSDLAHFVKNRQSARNLPVMQPHQKTEFFPSQAFRMFFEDFHYKHLAVCGSPV
jgi:hypothetical protein